MKSSCKSHLYATIFATWCHILSFATKMLCDLSKVTRDYSKSHVIIMTKNKSQIVIYLQIPYSSLNTQTGEIWSNILNSVHGWFKHCGYVQIVCVLYMIYRLVVQPNTTKAYVFAETLLANGGVEMLLIIL